LDILRRDDFSKREIEEFLRIVADILKSFISPHLGWLDVMIPVTPSTADVPNLLIANLGDESKWLKVLFSSIRRTNPPKLIPTQVNGMPWRGSGNALICGGMDYVSCFYRRFRQIDYGLPDNVLKTIETQYAYWQREHYFSSLLAVAILPSDTDSDDSEDAIGVLNLNFSHEDPIGTDDTLTPQRSIALCNVLEPALMIISKAIEHHTDRR
jgi:hypothetical protein